MQIVFLHVRQFFLNFLQLYAESLKGKDFIVVKNMNFCFSTSVPFSFQRIEQKSANGAFRNNQFCQVSCKEANTKQKNDISFQLKKEVKRILEIDSSCCFRQQKNLLKCRWKIIQNCPRNYEELHIRRCDNDNNLFFQSLIRHKIFLFLL